MSLYCACAFSLHFRPDGTSVFEEDIKATTYDHVYLSIYTEMGPLQQGSLFHLEAMSQPRVRLPSPATPWVWISIH
jgi:hypothetical protein